MVRRAAVAGRFYESDPGALAAQVAAYVDTSLPREEAIAALCPHAGLMYSGSIAGAVYSRLVPAGTFVLLGPNHTGMGPAVSIMPEGSWEVPTQEFEVDAELAAEIMRRSPLPEADEEAHRAEHSLEVQLPFIAATAPGAKIVPICIKSATPPELQELGEAIAGAITGIHGETHGEALGKVLIVASSDMSHFIPDGEARVKDALALDMIQALDPEGLYRIVRDESISMCGVMPAVAALWAALALGAKDSSLVKYTTSAEVSGDYEGVVGYAGVIIK